MLIDLRCFDDDGTVNPEPSGRTVSAMATGIDGMCYGFVSVTRDASGRLAYRASVTDPTNGDRAVTATHADPVEAIVSACETMPTVTDAVRAVAGCLAYPWIN